MLRRALSILLLAVLGLPLLAPLLALGAGADASVPACCRRNGKHHCLMSMGEGSRAAGHGIQMGVVPERCPYCPPGNVGAAHSEFGVVAAGSAIFAGLVSHPSVAAQTESRWRIARDRSRQKRGPPFLG